MTQQQPDAPPSQGLVAGKYELLRLIGRGGMGSVWEGRHTSLGTQVAIKFIEKEYADNEEARKRFDTEARAAAKLQSKHAIQIHDHGVTGDGKPYIVMEMLIGEPLDKRLERARVLSLQETAHIVQQVCRGLQKAHDNGIVHRDLKPENIFLVRDEDDGDEIAKVLDFGIAKIRNSPVDQSVSANTRTGAVLGTPFYMSPEQARGLRDIDHRTDLWSLGVIAFKCATGRLPFEGESLGDLLVKICTAPMPIPSQVNGQLPPSFDAWFSRALDREPARRFATASELGEALAYAAGLSVRRPGGSHPNPPPVAPVNPNPNPYAPLTPQPGTGTAGGYNPYNYNATPPPYTGQVGVGGYPGNMTNAPFVASATPSGGGGRGLLYAFAVITILVGVGLGTYGAIHYRAQQQQEAATAQQTVTSTAPTAPPNVTITPLMTATLTSGLGAPTATDTAHPTATVGNHTVPTAHGTQVAAHPTNTVPTTTATTPPTNTVTYTPTATATHPARPGEFGAGF